MFPERDPFGGQLLVSLHHIWPKLKNTGRDLVYFWSTGRYTEVHWELFEQHFYRQQHGFVGEVYFEIRLAEMLQVVLSPTLLAKVCLEEM